MLLTDDKTTSLVFLKTVKERPIQKNKNVEYTENGEYIVVPDDSFGVLEKVTVNVNVQPQLQDKDVVISTEDVIDVVADEGYSGLSKVQVIPSTKEYNKTINSNGQYNINEGKDLYNGGIITVDTPEPKQEIELTDTITENISKTYTPDDGYVYSKVNITVDVPPPAADWTMDVGEMRKAGGDDIFQSATFKEVPNNFIGWESLTNGRTLFHYCNSLISFDKDLPELAEAYQMFSYCTSLTSFNSELPKLRSNASSMFSNCSNLKEWNVTELPQLTDASSMFQNCYALTSFNTKLPVLTRGNNMFNNCSGLTSFDIELPQLTNGSSMFEYCKSLTTFNSELPQLTIGNYMFQYCSGLTSFNVTELPELTNGYTMFNNCSGLTSFNIEVPKLTESQSMFYNCYALTDFNSDLSSLTSVRYMFSGCRALANVTLKGSLNIDIDWSACPLTVDSMLSIMNAMVDLNGQTSKTMTFGSINLSKLSDEQKAIATNKNWVLN